MSSQTDKVIFVSSLVLAVGAGAFFVVGAEAPMVKDVTIVKAAPSPVTISEPINPLSVWAHPNPQRPLPQDPKLNQKPVPFVLHLFTPPKLYYKPVYWTLDSDTPPPKPFPLELKAIYQKPFRIQFGSYSKIGSEVTVYLKDLELRKEIEVKEGIILAEQGIQIKSVTLDDASEGGGINKIASVEILDTRSKRTYRLVEKQPELMEPTYYAKIYDLSSKREQEVVLGAKVTSEGVTYILKTLDHGTKTVSWEFQSEKMDRPEIQVLTITTPTKP